jgi:hypothetical protein
MTNILDFTTPRHERIKARAEAQNYALVQTAEGYELRCPFNARPQFFGADLAAVERFLANDETSTTSPRT